MGGNNEVKVVVVVSSGCCCCNVFEFLKQVNRFNALLALDRAILVTLRALQLGEIIFNHFLLTAT